MSLTRLWRKTDHLCISCPVSNGPMDTSIQRFYRHFRSSLPRTELLPSASPSRTHLSGSGTVCPDTQTSFPIQTPRYRPSPHTGIVLAALRRLALPP